MLITRQKFCQDAGITEDTLVGWIRRGYIATVKIGRRSMIDLSALPVAATPTNWANARQGGVAGNNVWNPSSNTGGSETIKCRDRRNG